MSSTTPPPAWMGKSEAVTYCCAPGHQALLSLRRQSEYYFMLLQTQNPLFYHVNVISHDTGVHWFSSVQTKTLEMIEQSRHVLVINLDSQYNHYSSIGDADRPQSSTGGHTGSCPVQPQSAAGGHTGSFPVLYSSRVLLTSSPSSSLSVCMPPNSNQCKVLSKGC